MLTNQGQMHSPVNPGYSQSYAPTGPPPASYNQNGYRNEKDPYANGRFKPKSKVNDVFFLLFFVLQFLGFAALSGYAIKKLVDDNGLGGGLGTHSGTRITLDQYVARLPLRSVVDMRTGTRYTSCYS
jgi:hypothetical protein